MSLLSDGEQEIINHLVSAWNAYLKVDKLHVEDTKDFAKAIHDAQRIIMSRPQLREYGWIEGGKNTKSGYGMDK